MVILIIGYPGSGKSLLAEETAVSNSEPGSRIYLATMIPYGEDGAERVRRHRRMREGKGFTTIEAPFDIYDAMTDALGDSMSSRTVLLECVSNLAANELFERRTSGDEAAEKICRDIERLAGNVNNLVIVSNHYEEEPGFDEETRLYAGTLDCVNDHLSTFADKVIRISEGRDAASTMSP